jgi:hypothetical protein
MGARGEEEGEEERLEGEPPAPVLRGEGYRL